MVFGGHLIKKGLKFKKKGALLTVNFKAPLQLNYDAPAEDIMKIIMDAIEQSKEYMMKGAHHWSKISNIQ